MRNKLIERKNGSKRVCPVLSDKIIVEKEHAKMADINNIVKQYKKTGVLPYIKQAFYADVSQSRSSRGS